MAKMNNYFIFIVFDSVIHIILSMPVRKEWYKVECLKNKRYISGIAEYLTKFVGYTKPEWIPFYDIDANLIAEYEQTKRDEDKTARLVRRCRRSIEKDLKRELNESEKISRSTRKW